MSSVRQSFISRRNFMRDTAAAGAGGVFAAGVKPKSHAYSEESELPGNWLDTIYRQLHIDAHFGECKEVYRDFDAEAAAQMLEEAGFQMVSYFAVCHAGYSYYPTKIGVVHPGLNRDFTGEFTAALKKRGIRCIVYVKAGYDRQYHKKHPEWIYNTDSTRSIVDKNKIGNGASVCLNSPWVDVVQIPQMKEIMSLYDVDGFFTDIVLQQYLESNCYCQSCRESFARDIGGDIPTEDNDPKAFAYRKWSNRQMESYMEKVYLALSETKPGIIIIHNYAWMSRYPVTPPPYVRQINWDTPPPSSGLYAWNFSIEARYLSTLPDVSWACHNTRGNTWGDYSLRDPQAFLHECALLLSGCGKTYLSDDAYPSGNPDPAVLEVYGAVNKRTRELEPYLKGCKPVKNAAVLHSADSIWSKAPIKPSPTWQAGPAYYSVNGAHKALIESHVQMGILNSETLVNTISEYGVLILPDQRILSERESQAIRSFVKNGGSLIATCETGTLDTGNNLLNNFSIADILGVTYLETPTSQRCYLRVKSKMEHYTIPAMDIQTGRKYARVKTTTAQTLLELVPSYGGKSAPAEYAECPGVTINTYGNGKVLYCSPQLFDTYYREGTSVLRKLILWMLDLVYPHESRTIVLENTPINVEVFFNHRGRERFIHFVNYSGDKREVGPAQVQDFTVVHGIRVKVKLGGKPLRITSVPDGKKIEFTYSDGWTSFTVEPLVIHSVYRIEV